jgi:hypothetical protein
VDFEYQPTPIGDYPDDWTKINQEYYDPSLIIKNIQRQRNQLGGEMVEEAEEDGKDVKEVIIKKQKKQ